MFWFLVPTDDSFLIWVSVLGFISGIYFGWLPLCLPELFPTRLRSTGAGFCFNVGRFTAAPVLFLSGWFQSTAGLSLSDAASLLSLLFPLGAVLLAFAPETKGKHLE